MPNVLIVSDADRVHAEVRAVLGEHEFTVREVRSGPAVREAVRNEVTDLAIVDMQVGAMGGFAICLDLHLEQSGGRAPHVPVLLLLDRRADVFLARRADAEGWVVKPLDPIRLRRAVGALLDGGQYHDGTYEPPTVAATSG